AGRVQSRISVLSLLFYLYQFAIAFDIPVAKGALQDLVGRPERHVLNGKHTARTFIGRQVFAAVGDNFRPVERMARMRDRDSDRNFALVLVREPDDGADADVRMLVEQILDFQRVDIVAARNNDVLLASDNEDIAIFILISKVAAQPALRREARRRRLGIAPVAGADRVAGNANLADLARRQLVARIINDANGRSADRQAGGAALADAVERFARDIAGALG